MISDTLEDDLWIEPGDIIRIPDPTRDMFAAAALTGLINRGFTEFGNAQSQYANLAYEYADAMLAQRGKK